MTYNIEHDENEAEYPLSRAVCFAKVCLVDIDDLISIILYFHFLLPALSQISVRQLLEDEAVLGQGSGEEFDGEADNRDELGLNHFWPIYNIIVFTLISNSLTTYFN